MIYIGPLFGFGKNQSRPRLAAAECSVVLRWRAV